MKRLAPARAGKVVGQDPLRSSTAEKFTLRAGLAAQASISPESKKRVVSI